MMNALHDGTLQMSCLEDVLFACVKGTGIGVSSFAILPHPAHTCK